MTGELKRDKDCTEEEQKLARQLEKCLHQDLNPKTINAYSSTRLKFEKWWDEGDWSKEWDIDLVRIFYLTELIEQGKSGTVPSTLSALNYYYGRVKDNYEQMLKSVLHTAARKTVPAKHREKVEKEDYDRFIDVGNPSSEGRVAALGVLLYRGMLRISEALALKSDEVSLIDGKWSIRISKSKTDQLGKGSVRVFEASGKEHEILTSWLGEVSRRKFDYIFQVEYGTARPICYNTANKMITERWRSLNLLEKSYTSHSFRGGAASAALEEGVLQANVQRFGRWKSEKAFECYVKETVQIQLNKANNS